MAKPQQDPRTERWLEREQIKRVEEFERGRDIQRELDRSLPGTPVQPNPPNPEPDRTKG